MSVFFGVLTSASQYL